MGARAIDTSSFQSYRPFRIFRAYRGAEKPWSSADHSAQRSLSAAGLRPENEMRLAVEKSERSISRGIDLDSEWGAWLDIMIYFLRFAKRNSRCPFVA